MEAPYISVRYESTNSKIAKVSKDGTIKAVKKGKTKIYVYSMNGCYKVINVNIK